MCGICGIYSLEGRPVRGESLNAMCGTMAHRGPDGQGVWVNGPVGLGHRRLSIIDLATGDQPMGTPDGAAWVVFNGEIYNFLELKSVLEGKGYRFRTTSDTESILYAYEEWGLEFVDHLRGMFAIGLWDERQRRLVLARDRIGKKPLYYLYDGKRLVFGSELKALLALPDVSKEMDFEALGAYLSFGYVPSPMSIFKHIRKLPPAHLAVCSGDEFRTGRYWRLDTKEQEAPGKEEEAVEELASIFDKAVKLRLISDVPLGAFLSGGVD
ncbi:MAG: asparagine synthase (glutamine-hydrolyzing), partial [Desulfobacteraceae bacterium]